MKCDPNEPNKQLRTMAPSTMSSPLGVDLDLTYCTVKVVKDHFLKDLDQKSRDL